MVGDDWWWQRPLKYGGGYAMEIGIRLYTKKKKKKGATRACHEATAGIKCFLFLYGRWSGLSDGSKHIWEMGFRFLLAKTLSASSGMGASLRSSVPVAMSVVMVPSGGSMDLPRWNWNWRVGNTSVVPGLMISI